MALQSSYDGRNAGYEIEPMMGAHTMHRRQPPRDITEYSYESSYGRNEPDHYSYKQPEDTIMEHTDIDDADWRPIWLHWGPLPIMFAILVMIVLYSVCLGLTKTKTYVAPSNQANDIIFRFGPTLIAVLLTEGIHQIIKDLSSIAPFWDLPFRGEIESRRKIANGFTDHRWSWVPRNALGLAILCYILVPSQSGLFEKSLVTVLSETIGVKAVNRTSFVESMNGSTFAGLAAQAVFGREQQTTPDLAKFRWIWRQNNRETWFGLMPFLPDQTRYSSSTKDLLTEDTIWVVDTQAISSHLACIDVRNFTLNIPNLERNKDTTTLSNVSLNIIDRDGCVVNTSWPMITTQNSPGMNNPISADNNIALWTTYRWLNMTVRDRDECNGSTWKSIVLAGPVPPSSNSNLKIDQSHTGWAALTCIPGTQYINNDLRYEASEDGLNYKVIDPPNVLGEGTEFREGRVLVDVMENNLLYNGDLIYNLTSPGYGKTFWGQNTSAMAKINTGYSLHECRFSDSEQKDKEKICELSRLCTDLWDGIFAFLVSTSAQIAPPEYWSTVDGTRETRSQGWAMSTGSYIYTLLVYLAIVLWLWADPRLQNRITSGSCRKQISADPTGLYSAPTTIAGLAYLMRRPCVRELFRGVDWMTADLGMKTMRKRFLMADVSLPHRNPPIALMVDASEIQGSDWSNIVAPIKKSRFGWLKFKKQSDASEPQKLKTLLQSAYPFEVKFLTLAAIAAICAILIPIVVKFIVLSKSEHFRIWKEDPKYVGGKLPSEGFRAWLQKQILEGGPVLVLTTIGIWWGMVDKFFRIRQPFASLAKDGDAKSMRLTYVHDFHLQITLRAFWNRHFRLSLVTFLTLLLKFAIVFSAGIFTMVTAPSPSLTTNPITHYWRSDTFAKESDTTFLVDALRDTAFSASFSGPLWRNSRNEGSYWYPRLVLSQRSTSSYKTNALKANMTCTRVSVKNVPNSDPPLTDLPIRPPPWNITITDGEVQGLTAPFACADKDWWLNKTEKADSLCTIWTHVTHDEWPKIPKENNDKWLIVAVNTLEGPNRPQNLAAGEPSQLSGVLCTSQFFLDELQIVESRDSDGALKSDFQIMSSKRISSDHWHQSGNSTLDFITFANQVISSALSKYDLSNTDVQGDMLGLMMMSDLGTADRLFNESLLGAAASNAFSTAIAALASINITSSGDTLFATGASPDSSGIEVNQYVYLAKLDRLSLYVGLGLLCAFLLAAILVCIFRDQPTPRDVKEYGNVMAMMYDSEFLDVIARSGQTRGFECLDGRRFAMGVYQGVSGVGCIGIDFEENVTKFGKKSGGAVNNGESLLQ